MSSLGPKTFFTTSMHTFQGVNVTCPSSGPGIRSLKWWRLYSKARKWEVTCCPPRDHNGEDACPDGDQGDGIEDWGGDGAHNVGPHPGAVHQALEHIQVLLEQRAVLPTEHDLEVALRQQTSSASAEHRELDFDETAQLSLVWMLPYKYDPVLQIVAAGAVLCVHGHIVLHYRCLE